MTRQQILDALKNAEANRARAVEQRNDVAERIHQAKIDILREMLATTEA